MLNTRYVLCDRNGNVKTEVAKDIVDQLVDEKVGHFIEVDIPDGVKRVFEIMQVGNMVERTGRFLFRFDVLDTIELEFVQ